jgi:hypothetical protein
MQTMPSMSFTQAQEVLKEAPGSTQEGAVMPRKSATIGVIMRRLWRGISETAVLMPLSCLLFAISFAMGPS